jgi:hypothetical protein
MTEISIYAVSAPQAVAELACGFRPDGLTVEMDGSFVQLDGRVEYRDFTELRFGGTSWGTARVTIERPRNAYGERQTAQVSWSSGGRSDLKSARATSRLLDFAVRVAEQMDAWAAAGKLPYLRVDEQTGEPTQLDLARQTNEACIQAARDLAKAEPIVGDLVDVAIYAPGPSDARAVGHLRGYVISAGAEYSVGLIDDEEDIADTLGRGDVDLDDLRESNGEVAPEGTPILENCQREWLTVVERFEAKS